MKSEFKINTKDKKLFQDFNSFNTTIVSLKQKPDRLKISRGILFESYKLTMKLASF